MKSETVIKILTGLSYVLIISGLSAILGSVGYFFFRPFFIGMDSETFKIVCAILGVALFIGVLCYGVIRKRRRR